MAVLRPGATPWLRGRDTVRNASSAKEAATSAAEAEINDTEAEIGDEDDDEEGLWMPESPPPFNPAEQVGAVAPLGFWDPLGFSPPGDIRKFRDMRSAELKHGRVAMLAALGGVAQHWVRFPFLGLKDMPAGIQATQEIPSAYLFWLLVIACGIVEFLVWTQDPNKEIGDFGDPLGLGMYDNDMRNRELNNGRFAMFAALGMFTAEYFTGKDPVQQLGL